MADPSHRSTRSRCGSKLCDRVDRKPGRMTRVDPKHPLANVRSWAGRYWTQVLGIDNKSWGGVSDGSVLIRKSSTGFI